MCCSRCWPPSPFLPTPHTPNPRRKPPRASRPCRPPATERRSDCRADGAKLYLPDEAYPRFPLPPGNAAYAHVDGLKMKAVVDEIAAISRKSRDDGNQYWGRIAGTPYDRMTEDWVMEQFRSIGLQNVRRQELDMKPLWYPESWKAEATMRAPPRR